MDIVLEALCVCSCLEIKQRQLVKLIKNPHMIHEYIPRLELK